MKVEGFIASRLRFKGKMAVIAIAISFLVMILAVAISSGFRREIRNGISSMTGDVILTNTAFSLYSDADPVKTDLSYLDDIRRVEGVSSMTPVIYRAGVIKNGDEISGVLFKGSPSDSASLCARIPSRLAQALGLKEGDSFLSYFTGSRTKARRFTVSEIYDSMVDTEGYSVVNVSDADLRRLNGWADNEATVIEIMLDERFKDSRLLQEKSQEIGSIAYLSAEEDEGILTAVSSVNRFAHIFDWLDLIDFNVYAILILMTLVAGFNMISGLLILLFRSISTIGMLKALGMTDRAIAGVFMRVSARIVGKGMLIGNGLAFLFCLIQSRTHLIALNPENYFVSFVPVSLNIPGVMIADLLAGACVMLLLLIPCMFISKIDPSLTVKSA